MARGGPVQGTAGTAHRRHTGHHHAPARSGSRSENSHPFSMSTRAWEGHSSKSTRTRSPPFSPRMIRRAVAMTQRPASATQDHNLAPDTNPRANTHHLIPLSASVYVV